LKHREHREHREEKREKREEEKIFYWKRKRKRKSGIDWWRVLGV